MLHRASTSLCRVCRRFNRLAVCRRCLNLFVQRQYTPLRLSTHHHHLYVGIGHRFPYAGPHFSSSCTRSAAAARHRQDKLLLVGTGEVAQIILKRIQWSPYLGYDLVGIIDDGSGMRKLRGVPVLGPVELARPDRALQNRRSHDRRSRTGTSETVRIISHCQRGRVSIKIFLTYSSTSPQRLVSTIWVVCRCFQCATTICVVASWFSNADRFCRLDALV